MNTHGESGNRLYRIWHLIRARCLNPNFPRFKDYGGRGIRLKWRNYEAFRAWAMSNGYTEELTIDRRNNDGDYSARNCRWIPIRDQARNKRNNRMLSAFGETKCCAAWAEDARCKVSHAVLRSRLHRGWGIKRALTQPLEVIAPKTERNITYQGKTLSVHAWAKLLNIHPPTLYARHRRGLPPEKIFAPTVKRSA